MRRSTSAATAEISGGSQTLRHTCALQNAGRIAPVMQTHACALNVTDMTGKKVRVDCADLLFRGPSLTAPARSKKLHVDISPAITIGHMSHFDMPGRSCPVILDAASSNEWTDLHQSKLENA